MRAAAPMCRLAYGICQFSVYFCFVGLFIFVVLVFFLNWHAHCIDFSELLASPQRPTSTTQEVVQQEGWLDSLVSKG